MSEISVGILISTLVIVSAFFLYFLIFPSSKASDENMKNEQEQLRNTVVKKLLFGFGFLSSKVLLIGLLIYLYKNRELIDIRELGGAFLLSSFFIWSIIVVLGYFYKPLKK